MISEQRYFELKEQIAQIEKKREQTIGAKKQIEETLKKEFGCKTIVQAERLIKKLKKEKKINETKFWASYRKYKKELRVYNKTLEKSDTT